MVPSLMPGSEFVSTVTSCGPLPEAFELTGCDSVQDPGLSAPPTPSVVVAALASELVPPADESLPTAAAPPVPVVPTVFEPLDDIPARVVVTLVVWSPLLLEALALLAGEPGPAVLLRVPLVVPIVVPPLVCPVPPDVCAAASFPALALSASFAASAPASPQPPSTKEAIAAHPVRRDACTVPIPRPRDAFDVTVICSNIHAAVAEFS